MKSATSRAAPVFFLCGWHVCLLRQYLISSWLTVNWFKMLEVDTCGVSATRNSESTWRACGYSVVTHRWWLQLDDHIVFSSSPAKAFIITIWPGVVKPGSVSASFIHLHKNSSERRMLETPVSHPLAEEPNVFQLHHNTTCRRLKRQHCSTLSLTWWTFGSSQTVHPGSAVHQRHQVLVWIWNKTIFFL